MDIQPENQNIDKVFSNNTYHIDFYQRDYKWNDVPVLRILDDIFYKFNENYDTYIELDPCKKVVLEKYKWYYLNTYVTNTIDGNVYIVDGQQRLTTITLMLMVLYHHSDKKHNCDQNLIKWIETKIAGYSGDGHCFWMNHEKSTQVLQDLFKGKKELSEIDTTASITSVNLVANYQTINKWFTKHLPTKHKFETFIYYFLYRLVIINLSVEQTEVPMVFEVINDRGVKLKPYEILKGKLLGQVDKIELDNNNYNDKWEDAVNEINDYKEDEIDTFFRFYLKSKFANTRPEGTLFDGDYHREIFSGTVNDQLSLNHNSKAVKNFLNNDFSYYSHLYIKILKAYKVKDDKYPSVFHNKLNDLDGQLLLILSSCKINDDLEDDKIELIAYEVDRLFALLQLQNSYDSNSFYELLYSISSQIRNGGIDEIRPAFDKHLTDHLSKKRNSVVTSPFHYTFFKSANIGIASRFVRYFFARIDLFLSENLNLGMKHPIEDLVSKTGAKTGFHIEHILSHNAENLAYYNNDEELFEQERNRLGGILLLKGRDNISSNNELYTDKLKSYANTLYWNETLRSDAYKSKLDMNDMMQEHNLNLRPLDRFGKEELEERHKLLSDIIKIIWK